MYNALLTAPLHMEAAGFSQLTEWLSAYRTPLILVLNVLIGLMAIIFAGPLIIKIMSDIKAKKWNDAGKNLGGVIGIVIIAGLGMYGVIAIAKNFVPDGQDKGNFDVTGTAYVQTVDEIPGSPYVA